MQTDLSSFSIQPYRRKFIKPYMARMSTDNLSELMDGNVASVLKEQGFTILDNPRSVYRVEKLYEALAKYAPKNAPRVNMKDEHLMFGVNLAYSCFGRTHGQQYLDVQAFTPQFIQSITSNPGGSAGLTAYGQKKEEAYLRAYEVGIDCMLGHRAWEPCLAFKRTQFNDKTRLVWGYPFAATAVEGIFARPLINRFKLGNTPMAFAKSTGVLGAELRTSSYHKKYAYSTDLSSYDSSISADLIGVAFSILSTWFRLNDNEQTSGVSLGRIWKQIVGYYIHTPIVMPDGNIYKGKRHGVPSGSYFTQLIDSIVNVIICGAISSKFKLGVYANDIQVLGDDLLFWSNHKVKLEYISDYLSKTFSMKMNVLKSSLFQCDEVIHFLGRDWNCGVPSLSQDDITTRMSQPETYRVYPKEKEARDIEVRKLLLSYASVYRDAYPIYLKCMDVRPRYDRTNEAIESYAYGGSASDVNPDYMSGLQRFKLKYVYDKHGGRTPLALQFWK